MSKIKRLIAVLMAAVMIFGTMSASASAAYNGYLDDDILGDYNSIDKVELSIAQKSSLLLDDLDVMLEKEEIVIDIPLIGTIDLTSTDAALDSIYDLTGNWLYGSLTVGDLVVLETYRDNIASVRRDTAGKTDKDVITSLVAYLSNCAPTLLNMVVPDSGFSWGIVKGFLPPEFRVIIDDLPGFLYETLWDLLHPVNAEAMPEGISLDYIVQFMCDNQLGAEEGSARANAMGFAGVMPGFDVNIETDSAYRIFEEAIYEALNAFIIPVLNGSLKQTIQSAVTSNQEQGGELHLLINTDYVIQNYEFNDSLGFVEQINDVFKVVVEEMLLEGKSQWVSTADGAAAGRSNVENLVYNLEVLLKQIIVAGGETENVQNYDLKDLGDYIARVAVEQFVKHLDFEKGDSMEKIAYEGVRELVVRFVPEVTYADLPANTTSEQYRDAIIEMGADIACYYLNANIGLNCDPATTNAEQFISAFIDWCMPYINGLFDATDYNAVVTGNGTGWDEINAIIWEFIPKDWMNYADMFADANGAGTADDLTFRSLINYFIDAVFKMDIEKLFIFFEHVDGNPLNNTARQTIITFVSNILNNAFYTTDANGNKVNAVPALATFDAIINPVTNATSIISNILKALATRTELQDTTINLVTMLMGLADPQSLGDVDMDIDSRINCTSGSVNTNLRISNRSEGVNSAWRDTAGVLHQDKMYEIELVSLTNNGGLTASVTSGQKIPANGYINVDVTGTVDATKEVRFDLSYYILDEGGYRINDGTPLVSSVYTHLFTVAGNYEESSAEVSVQNVTFDSFGKYLYTTDVYNVSLFSILATNALGLWNNGSKDIVKATVTGTLPAGITANAPASGAIITIDNASLGVDSYGTVNPYTANIDPDDPQPYGIYDVDLQFVVKTTGSSSTGTTAARDHIIVIYDDYNLGGVLDGVMSANRQRVDYATDADAEWTAYQNAVSAGYALLNGNPDHSKMFVDSAFTSCVENDYYDAVQAINAAVAALDAKAKPTDTALLATLNAEIAEHGAVDSDNYVLFTYDRFKDAYNRATGLANSQVDTGVEGWAAPAIPSFDLVYATEQLALWGSRLIERETVKTHLWTILGPVEGWNEEVVDAGHWTAFDDARDDAVTAYNDTDALQTEVNDARIALMRAMKGIAPNFLKAVGTKSTVVDSTNFIVYGLGLNLTTTTISEWVTAVTGYTATPTANSTGKMGTGSIISVYESGNTEAVATYSIIIYCDLNGDGLIGTSDEDILGAHLDGDDTSILVEGSAKFIAADLNRDGSITEADYDLFSTTIDQVNPAA